MFGKVEVDIEAAAHWKGLTVCIETVQVYEALWQGTGEPERASSSY